MPILTRRETLVNGLALLTTIAAACEAAADPDVITFDTLYKTFGIRGLEFSDRLLVLRGREVSMAGYMAPPLKPESHFFVLTREPVAICPFCQSDAEWPLDIVVVFLKGASALVSAGQRVRVSGRLDTGSWLDPESGFVSQLRIMDAQYRKA